MAAEYKKIPIANGQILGNPRCIAISRKSNILAVSIALTSGIMLQAFRITPTGLTPITVNGQMTAVRDSVSVSPNGTYIIVGNTAVNQARFEIWKYNTATGQYDKLLSGPTDTSRYSPNDGGFEWLSEDTFIRSARFASGSTYRGSTGVYKIVGSAANTIYERFESTSYAGTGVAVSPDGNNFITGYNGALTRADSYFWDGNTGVTYVGSTTVGTTGPEYLTSTRQVAGPRTGSGAGTKIFDLNGENDTEILGAIAQDLGSTTGTVVRIFDGIFFVNTASGATFYQFDGTQYVTIPAPTGLSEINGLGAAYRKARFTDTMYFGLSSPTANDIRLFQFIPEPGSITARGDGIMGDAFARMQKKDSVSFIQAGPMGDAWATFAANGTTDLFAQAPMGDAILVLSSPESTRFMAIAPMGDAWFTTIGQHFINVAVAPMGDAWLNIENVSFDFVAQGLMGDAWLNTVEFTGTDLFAQGPMGDATITFSPQWMFVEPMGIMGEAHFDIPNVYVPELFAQAPMGEAYFDIPNVYVRSLVAVAPMGTATLQTSRAVTSFVAQGIMGEASFDIPNVYVEAAQAQGIMGEAFLDLNNPPHGNLVAVAPMGDAAIAFNIDDLVCRRRSMMFIQVL